MFVLYKLLGAITTPLPLTLLLLAGSLWLPQPRLQRSIGSALLALLWVASLPIVGRQVLRGAEGNLPPTDLAQLPRADAIVVLSGDFPDRELCALRLWQQGLAPRILFSGLQAPGNDVPFRALLQLPSPQPGQFLVEQRSRNTAEGGQAFRRIAQQQGWQRVLLVSGAYHLPRALQLYQAPGITLVPAICPELRLPPPEVFRQRPLDQQVLDWVPSARGLWFTSSGLKELVGRLIPGGD